MGGHSYLLKNSRVLFRQLGSITSLPSALAEGRPFFLIRIDLDEKECGYIIQIVVVNMPLCRALLGKSTNIVVLQRSMCLYLGH